MKMVWIKVFPSLFPPRRACEPSPLTPSPLPFALSPLRFKAGTDIPQAVDFFQEKVLGQGPQDNESAIEQAKDEQISDFIRGKYKDATGSEVPIKDKETRFG